MIKMLVLFFLLPVTLAQGAGDPALEAMEALRRGFTGNTDFIADITQEKQLALMKQKLLSKGQVRFKKPDTFFMEIYPPHASRLLLKDHVMAMRLMEQGVTERIALPPEESLSRWFAYLAKPVTALPQGVDVKAERHGKLWTMRITPHSKGGVKQLTLSFDLSGAIKRIVIEERNQDSTTLTFSRIRRNVGLTDHDFRLE